MASHGRAAALLIYDSNCGPCTRFAKAVKLLDVNRRVQLVTLTEADRRGLLDAVRPEERFRTSYLLRKPGSLEVGADYVPDLMAYLPGGGLLELAMKSWRPASSFGRFVFGVLSRLHDAGSCVLQPQDYVAQAARVAEVISDPSNL